MKPVDPWSLVGLMVGMVVAFVWAIYCDRGAFYEGVQDLLSRWRAWRRRHLSVSTHEPSWLRVPPMHPGCRCAPVPLMADALAKQRHVTERSTEEALAAHFGAGEVTPVPGGGYRHTFNLRDGLRPRRQLLDQGLYRPRQRTGPKERPIQLTRERCRYCPAILPPEQLARHQRAHLN